MMTKEFLLVVSLWAGLSKEVRAAIEYSVREGKTGCELWLDINDPSTKKILEKLGFEVERVSIDRPTRREYLTITWDKLPK